MSWGWITDGSQSAAYLSALQSLYDQIGALEEVNVAGALRGETAPQNHPAIWGPSTRTLSADGRTWLLRYVPTRAWDIALAKWDVTVAAGSDDSVELALYSDDLQTKIATSGVQTGQLNGSTGIKGVDLVASVEPGEVYYLAFKAPVALGSTGASVNGRTCNGVSTTLFGTSVPAALAGFIDGLSSPLPATITAASVNWTSLSSFPLVALREV